MPAKIKAKRTKPIPDQVLGLENHLRQLHDFIEHLMVYMEDPWCWPLSQQEQMAFVREVLTKARKLKDSKGFVQTKLLLAVDNLKKT